MSFVNSKTCFWVSVVAVVASVVASVASVVVASVVDSVVASVVDSVVASVVADVVALVGAVVEEVSFVEQPVTVNSEIAVVTAIHAASVFLNLFIIVPHLS